MPKPAKEAVPHVSAKEKATTDIMPNNYYRLVDFKYMVDNGAAGNANCENCIFCGDWTCTRNPTTVKCPSSRYCGDGLWDGKHAKTK